MRTESFLSLNPQGFHRVVYHEWGAVENQRVLVCVHGLARNSRDFDELALALSRDFRVVCPDIVGRGQSDWLPSGSPYELGQYINDMVALLARLKVERVDWLGTSMGGLIGMLMAAMPNSPIQRLVLNDIGPFISQACLQRIGDYVGLDQRFGSLEAVENYLRDIYADFGQLEDRQWQHLAQHSARQCVEQGAEEGTEQWALHYDPVIGDYSRQAAGEDVDLWALWQQIQCRQLLIWGERSDVLERQTVERMQQNPALSLLSYPQLGHAPSLMETGQIQSVIDWFRNHPAES
ncbi:alpha/beta hydrolase [Motiliproteus coralliicola]|uniref:Alpha/beta hydrolase n=1 Tax=Motiliproteus coralliicola TaxID=2283196 RepID=A0A369WRF5_9GAMM|nr:alpha/beta hydrolase [Motiliproteus coralliicola]RDE24121.1 alpha/beta hydrolase [Motiliproteus coralliicola]